jgi:NADH-quinone oxidoreductase subunit G
VNEATVDWALPVANTLLAPAADWVRAMAEIAGAVAELKGIDSPFKSEVSPTARAVAKSLLSGERKAVLLGNGAAHHSKASSLLAIANWIGEHTGAVVGFLTEAANTVGAQLVGATPGKDGLNAAQMLAGSLKAVLLLNNEPVFDSAAGVNAKGNLSGAEMVVTLSPFKANMEFSDVLLPIAPFTETSGTFVNAEGRVQSFHAVVKPLGEARPAWKVLRVLSNLLKLPNVAFESSQDILSAMRLAELITDAGVSPQKLSNACSVAADLGPVASEPVVSTIYQLDGIVRRATSLQLTADARSAALASTAQEALA